MSNTPNHLNNHPSSPKNPTFPASDYELRVSGHLGPQTPAWFEDMTLTVNEETTPPHTIIRGYIVDQAALYGLINRARDLGLTLVSVKRLGEDKTEDIEPQALEGEAYDNIEAGQAAESAGD
ncbi:MAG: hypothetical protein R3264_09830 [Anaerolineae bacterium]|nr:hypothetical protein [Anaerolineae bacterium]